MHSATSLYWVFSVKFLYSVSTVQYFHQRMDSFAEQMLDEIDSRCKAFQLSNSLVKQYECNEIKNKIPLGTSQAVSSDLKQHI